MAILDVNELAKRVAETALDDYIYKGKPIRSWIDELAERQWCSVQDALPENGVTVLAVKQLKSGQRIICLAYCIPEYAHTNPVTKETRIAPYWVCGGNNNIIYWQPLPEIPAD